MKKAYTTIELIIVVVGIPLFIGVLGGVGYIISHFIAKLW